MNNSTQGGAVYNKGEMSITQTNFMENTANRGGGIYTEGNNNLQLFNTILANSTSGGDCYNYPGDSIVTNINNLIEANGPPGHMCGIPGLSSDPVLGPLVNNGGLTHTSNNTWYIKGVGPSIYGMVGDIPV